MPRAHLLCLQNCQEEPFFRPISQQVHHLSETHIFRVCRSIKLTSLRDASVDFGIPNFGQLFHAQTEEDWGHEVSGLVLRYDQNVLIDIICIKLQSGLLYYCQPFHCPTSVERLGLDSKVEYSNANQGIMPESHNIWVQYTDSDLDNTSQGWLAYISCIILQLDSGESDPPISGVPAHRKKISTLSKRRRKTQQWVVHPQTQEYAVVIPTRYKDPHGWVDCVDRFIRVVERTDKMHIVLVRAIVGPADLLRENAASDRNDSV